MDRKILFEAARAGKVEVLERLLHQNPSILDDIKLTSLTESLLHAATKSGQLNFVRELLKIDPDIAGELDNEGFRALDIVVIMGKVAIVKELLSFDGKLTGLTGKDDRRALHYAAAKGRVEIIDELLSACPDCLEYITVHGETALHLAVKNYQFNAFAVLVKWLERCGKGSIINTQDGDGNTVLHLAVSTKQYACLKVGVVEKCFLKGTIEMNVRNVKGLTALDIWDIMIQDCYEAKVRGTLQQAGAVRDLASMERRLIEAAKNGDVEKLHNLIKDAPFLLSTAALRDDDTPLHIACIGGHVDFVREVLILGQEFAVEFNRDGLSPLHIASARGDVEIVKELLKVGSHLCLAKGKERRIPLHSAVAKGRIQVITELLSASLDSITQVTARGETCLHLAVKNYQHAAFKVLCEHVVSSNKEDMLNSKDDRGNTILHLAASRKQYEVFDLLLEKNSSYKTKLDVNSLNKNHLAPLDILRSEGGDSEIEEILTLAGAASPINSAIPTHQDQSINGPEQEERRNRPKSASQKLQDYLKYDKMKESPSKARNTLLVITVLIATATYQAVLSPPGGVWQDDLIGFSPNAAKNNSSEASSPHKAGQAVMGTNNYIAYGLFLLFNSMGFFMSLHMMNFLTLGLPLQFELRVALLALITTYDTCMVAIAPRGLLSTFFIVLSFLMPLIMALLTKVVRDYNKGWHCESRTARVVAAWTL